MQDNYSCVPEYGQTEDKPLFGGAQIAGAAAMSFMHGAQDGQKFIGVLFLGIAFSGGHTSVSGMEIPVWLMLVCSVVMAVGTSVRRWKDY